MKNTLALVLIVFGIVGCVSSSDGSIPYYQVQTSHQTSLIWGEVIVERYEDLTTQEKAEAMNINSGQKFHFGSAYDYGNSSEYSANQALRNCELLYKSKCIVSRRGSSIYYENLTSYKNAQADMEKRKNDRLAIANERIRVINQKAKERKVKELIARCEEFGFKGDNNIAACVQREVQVDLALAKQEEKIDQLENRIDSLAQSRESKTESSSSILVDLLSILADEAEKQDELEQKIRLYKVESEVSTLRSSKNVKQATCSLNRNC